MKFQPKTEAEVKQANVWPKGNYPFEIVSAEDKKSRAGNDMIELKVKLFNADGKTQTVFDYLLGDTMEYKLRHAAEVCELIDAYETGELEAYQFVGHTGTVKVGVQPEKDGYPARNTIQDYIPNPPKDLKEALKDDTIPF